MPEPISNLIANLISSELFYIFCGIWLLLSLANKNERTSLTDRLADLISKPVIFDKDKNNQSVPFYPRETFERVAVSVSEVLIRIPKDINERLERLIDNQYRFIVDPEKRWKVLGYTINLVFLFFFVWADGIAITNALDALGYLGSVWAPLTYYELAVALGSFFAIIVGALVARDLFSEKSDFSDWESQKGAWKSAAKFLTVFLMISGLLVVFILGVGRFQRLGFVPEVWNSAVNNIVNVTTLILVPLNTVVATILIHYEAFKGFLLALILIEGVIWILARAWQYVAEILGAMGPFTVDVIYRLMLALIFIIVFLLITPLDFITGLFPKRK